MRPPFFIGTGNYKLCDINGTPKVTQNGTAITITDGENTLEITSGKLSMTLIVNKNIFQWSQPKNPAEFKTQVRKIANLIGASGTSPAPKRPSSLSASDLRDLKDFATMPLGCVPVSSVISASDARISELCNQYFQPSKTQDYLGNYYIRYPDGLDLTILGKKSAARKSSAQQSISTGAASSISIMKRVPLTISISYYRDSDSAVSTWSRILIMIVPMAIWVSTFVTRPEVSSTRFRPIATKATTNGPLRSAAVASAPADQT